MPRKDRLADSLALSRRSILKAGGGLAACLAAGTAPAVVARAQETLIVNSQGGEYQQIFERTVIEPFKEQFGVTVIHDPTGTASQDFAKIRASGGAPGFDVAVVLTPPEVILGAREGLLLPITEDKVPNLKRPATWCPSMAPLIRFSMLRSSTIRMRSNDRRTGLITGRQVRLTATGLQAT
jgi:hypothetical protein